MTSRFPDDASDIAQRRSAEVSSLSRSRSAAPGSAYTSRPSSSRTFISPSCAMSRETVVCTASKPRSRSASATSSWVVSRCSWTIRRIVPWRSNLLLMCEPPGVVATLLGREHQAMEGRRTRACWWHGRVRGRTSAPRDRGREAWRTAPGGSQNLLEDAERVLELLVRDRQRGSQAQDALARGADDDAAVEAVRDHVPRDVIDLDAEQQTGAANLDDARQPFESGGEVLTLANDVLEQLLRDRRENGARGGGNDGIAAECRTVVAGLESTGGFRGNEQRADRQSVREPLRERDGIRLHAEPLPGEEAAGPPHPGLHLVEDEQRAVRVRELARLFEEAHGCRVDPALALDRLE